MKGDSFTIGELAEEVTGGNERSVRHLLNTVAGETAASEWLDPYATDPTETVTRETVIALFAQRPGDRVGRKLGRLLRETTGGADDATDTDD